MAERQRGSRRPGDPEGAEVSARERTGRRSVGPASAYGKPITIAGIVVAVLAVLWAVFYSGLVL